MPSDCRHLTRYDRCRIQVLIKISTRFTTCDTIGISSEITALPHGKRDKAGTDCRVVTDGKGIVPEPGQSLHSDHIRGPPAQVLATVHA